MAPCSARWTSLRAWPVEMIDHLSSFNYDAAFVRDPDGNPIEALTRRPEDQE